LSDRSRWCGDGQAHFFPTRRPLADWVKASFAAGVWRANENVVPIGGLRLRRARASEL
jgi:hypothetical protein